jgi:hypothetical protein
MANDNSLVLIRKRERFDAFSVSVGPIDRDNGTILTTGGVEISIPAKADARIEFGVQKSRAARHNINALYDLVLALERPISAKPVDIAAYEAAEFPLYWNAKAEGVVA